MHKRISALALCLLLLLGTVLPVCAAEKKETEESEPIEITIASPAALLALAENCRLDTYSRNLVVYLAGDLDLSGMAFESIPIFSGTFDGRGHTISGLSVTADGSVQGLFRYLTGEAVVRDLSIMGQIRPGGSRSEVGAIAGRSEGSILNCSFRGNVSGGSYVGGLVGRNGTSGILEDCSVTGEIQGDHFVGGIAGENCGVIRSCSNEARVNTTPQQNTVEITDITMDILTNSEAVNTVTDIGGITGINSGVIRSCENKADVGYRHMGYNVGGIAGTQSGYLADCTNRGAIQGRKEAGGIVGQMEPVNQIEYKEDTLKILQRQLGTMSGLVNKASSNAQNNAGKIGGQIDVLYDQAQDAWDAVDILIPDSGAELPDADSVLAAQNVLTSTLYAMPQTLSGIAYAAQNTVTRLGRDLQAISSQITAMGRTINEASENLGGTITDVSDEDAGDNLTGKAENCINYGSVLADLNVGGIAGAIAMENDLDILEDWEQYGEESLNFHSKVRTVILNCENNGTVTGKKQNVGGITGWQSLGLVKNAINTGSIDGTGAEYVGGISGLSSGFIRSCSAKCLISGESNVAGIAGSATIATDTLSMVKITDSREKLGAVLGTAGEYHAEEEEDAPISGNYYLPAEHDYGAIDGISYTGLAEPLSLEVFLQLENLPDCFKKVTVRFLYEDGRTKELSLKPGQSLSTGRIPLVPKKQGYTGIWEGLENADLTNILFDMTFEAVYTAYRTTIQSAQTRENGLPILLAEGAFRDTAELSVEVSEGNPPLEKDETLLEVWSFELSQPGKQFRFLLPPETAPDALTLLASTADGTWQPVAFTPDGSYLVFPAGAEQGQLALVQSGNDSMLPVVIAAAAVLIAAVWILVQNRAAGKKRPDEEDRKK